MSETISDSPTTQSYHTDSQASEAPDVEDTPSLEEFDGSEQYPPSDEEGNGNQSTNLGFTPRIKRNAFELFDQEGSTSRISPTISSIRSSRLSEKTPSEKTPGSILRKHRGPANNFLTSTPVSGSNSRTIPRSHSKTASRLRTPQSVRNVTHDTNSPNWLLNSETSLDFTGNSSAVRKQSYSRSSGTPKTGTMNLLDLSNVYETPDDKPVFSEQEIEELKANLVAEADIEIEDLRVQVEQALDEREEMEKEVSQAEAETNSLRIELESLQANPPQLPKIQSSSNSSNIELKKKLEYLRNELKRRDTEREWYMMEKEKYTNTCKKINISLEAELEHVRIIQEQIKNDEDKFTAEISMLTMEEKSLRESIIGSKSEADRVRSLFNELKSRYDELKRIVENARKKETSMIQTVKELQKNVISTEEEVGMYREQQYQLNDSVDMRVAEERSKYESDVMEYKARLQSTKEEALRMRDRFDSMIGQLSVIIDNDEDDDDDDDDNQKESWM